MLPDFVIIGAQKSASTYLQLCLNDHPDIFLPDGETPYFESPDYEKGSITDIEHIFENRAEQCLGLKRPSYLGKTEVPSRIESDLPDTKLIAILRNPVDRAISAYFHLINYGFLPVMNIEKGVREILNDSTFRAKYIRSSEIIEFGYYWKYLNKYKSFLSRNKVLILLHDDILTSPLKYIQEVYTFLGVANDYIPFSINSTPQKVIYSLPRLKILSLRNKYLYRYNNRNTRLSLKSRSYSEQLLSKIITLTDTKILSKITNNTKPDVSQDLRESLYETYAYDIALLEKNIGRDLSSWKTQKASSNDR